MLDASQKSSYNFLESENQNNEYLIENKDFIDDARSFLTKRGGYSEERLQDKYRSIKLLNPIYLSQFVSEFEKLIGE